MHRWLSVLTVAAPAGMSAGAGPRSHSYKLGINYMLYGLTH